MLVIARGEAECYLWHYECYYFQIARLTVLSHANSISLLIYTLLYTAFNKNSGVTKVNFGGHEHSLTVLLQITKLLFHSSRAITDFAYNFNVTGVIHCRISYGQYTIIFKIARRTK